MFAGLQGLLGHVKVQPVWRGDVHDLHIRVIEDLLKMVVGLLEAQPFGAGLGLFRIDAEDPGYRNPRPKQALHMNRADKPRPDHGRMNRCHSFLPFPVNEPPV